MRKQVLACLLLGALGAQAQEKFVVEGQLKNIPDGTASFMRCPSSPRNAPV
jgi:hypothetical protein